MCGLVKLGLHLEGWHAHVLSSLLTLAVVILCATGSNTMALPLFVLPNGFGSGGDLESLGIVTVR